MSSVISIKNLSKCYNLRASGSYLALRDVLTYKFKNVFNKKEKPNKDFWALQDINIEIEEGERLGIIGSNGAGKSTLLKTISRITPPTKGKIILSGRVASLLEVGTGFHPELTGRENIYLNGSILGLKKNEIEKSLDEIVDFSGVKSFIDSPLKYYSSGMQMRLAFAVAAHLQADILLIDEVLAVGDLEFQKKCIGKMEEISNTKGRTILFVSHNLEAVRHLCSKALLLQKGQDVFLGRSQDTIEVYKNLIEEVSSKQFITFNKPLSTTGFTRAGISQLDLQNNKLQVQIQAFSHCSQKVSFEIIIKDHHFNPIIFYPLGLKCGIEHTLRMGFNEVLLEIELPYLAKGNYHIDLIVGITGKEILDLKEQCLSFTIDHTYVSQTGWEFKQTMNQGSILGNGKSIVL